MVYSSYNPLGTPRQLCEYWTAPFEVAFANFTSKSPSTVDARDSNRGPLLLVSGSADHSAPEVVTMAAYKMYGRSEAFTEFVSLPGRGHALSIDDGWHEVAQLSLIWLQQERLDRVRTTNVEALVAWMLVS